MKVGRIVASVRIENLTVPSSVITCEALVDTGASLLVLPRQWKKRLGPFESAIEIEVEVATQETVVAEVCGPVRIQIEGFRPIFNEIAFIDMKPTNGNFEPLIGYIVLEQSMASVDMLSHRLVPSKHMDLKSINQKCIAA